MLANARSHGPDPTLARAEYEEVVRPNGRLLPAHNLAFAHLALGDLDRLEGDHAGARRHYAASDDAMVDWPVGRPELRALVLVASAYLEVADGDPVAAGRMLAEAAEVALSTKDMPVLAKVGVAVATVLAAVDDPAGAALVLGAAEQLRGAPDPLDHDVAGLVSALRAEMGDAAYDAARSAGRALDRAAAIDQVLRR
jgi:hypothetical protein